MRSAISITCAVPKVCCTCAVVVSIVAAASFTSTVCVVAADLQGEIGGLRLVENYLNSLGLILVETGGGHRYGITSSRQVAKPVFAGGGGFRRRLYAGGVILRRDIRVSDNRARWRRISFP